jgi:hypothetical protein
VLDAASGYGAVSRKFTRVVLRLLDGAGYIVLKPEELLYQTIVKAGWRGQILRQPAVGGTPVVIARITPQGRIVAVPEETL